MENSTSADVLLLHPTRGVLEAVDRHVLGFLEHLGRYIWLIIAFVTFSLSCSDAGAGLGRCADIIRHMSVYQSQSEYCAWPSLAKTSEGDLIVLFTRTEEHLGPNGAILLSRSTDNGKSWLSPVVVLDSPIDDRESGITTLRDGRILGHFWSTFWTRGAYEKLSANSYRSDVLDRWIATVEQPAYRDAEKISGAWSAVSSDGGRTWSKFVRGFDSVHGGIELVNGKFLLASYRTAQGSILVHEADSALGPWRLTATLAPLPADSVTFAEPHILQLPSGRVIMMIRVEPRFHGSESARCTLWESYSDDGGRTWVRPFETSLWGLPPHLALLSDGRVLCTYGYRRAPYGERACLSSDGVNWNLRDEVVLRDDAPNGDLGYPASIELEPGVVLTVYYQPDVPAGTTQQMSPPDPERVKPGILGMVWRIPGGTITNNK